MIICVKSQFILQHDAKPVYKQPVIVYTEGELQCVWQLPTVCTHSVVMKGIFKPRLPASPRSSREHKRHAQSIIAHGT